MVVSAPGQFKTWSWNLGHEKVLTTFLGYGEDAYERQGEIRGLMRPQQTSQSDVEEITDAVLRRLLETGVDTEFEKRA